MSGLPGQPATRPLVSLVVPFYNESAGVAAFQAAITATIDAIQSVEFEIVCVDDGSRDDTLARLLAMIPHDGRFRVIELSRNFGREAALTAGIEAARGSAVIPMDADLQDPPHLIMRMVAAWRDGADVVLARRVDRAADSFTRRKTAQFFYRFHNQVSSVKIPENVGDFRLMDRKVVDALARLPESQRFMKGLFAWVGFRQLAVPYAREPRLAGGSKFNYWRLWNLALEGITSFSTVPLRLATYIGVATALLAFIWGLVIVVRTLAWGDEVQGWPTMMTVILFLGGLQLVALGIIGEYLGRIYLETKQRPLYLVAELRPPAVS